MKKNIPVFRILPVLLLFTLLVNTSFNSGRQKNYDASGAAPGDFSWLTDFYILSQCLTLEHWQKTPGKSFDSAGISLTNGKYHPVNLFQYGIYCFDMYRKTKNEDYKKKCLAQFGYFRDTSRYIIRPDGTIGFPYQITFRDLKPIWYSGLAQSEGMMYLIRYYYLTKDPQAIIYIKRIYDFMLVDQCDGGTFNTISDSEVWIEEYPNSKSKPEVLNGFVTSIMAMREYCFLFPDDKDAKKILEKCISTHKKWFHKYDMGNGVLYDLGEKQQVGPWYMKFQVIQMKHMYDLFRDPFYKNIEMLWATYAYNKIIPGMFGCLLNDTNYSIPAKPDNSNEYMPVKYPSSNFSSQVSTYAAEGINRQVNIKAAFDQNPATYINLRYDSTMGNKIVFTFQLNKSVTAGSVDILSFADTLNPDYITFFVRQDSTASWKYIKRKNTSANGKSLTFEFSSTTFSEMKFEFRNPGLKKMLQVCDVTIIANEKSNRLSFYSHFEKDFQLSPGKNYFNLVTSNIDSFAVFYKTGNDINEAGKAKWKVYDVIRENAFSIDTKDKVGKFLVVIKNGTDSKCQLIKRN